MDVEVSELSISQIEVTLPNRIFEVSHLMKRESSVSFLAADTNGEFNRNIKISKPDDSHVCVSLSVDNLTFLANKICFSADEVKAENEDLLQNLLNDTLTTTTKHALDSQITSVQQQQQQQTGDQHAKDSDKDNPTSVVFTTPLANQMPKRKRGRPRKSEQQQQASASTKKLSSNTTAEEKKEMVESEQQLYLVTPSGRRIRKPVRYRENTTDIDKAVKELDSDASSGSEYDDDDMIDPDFSHAAVHTDQEDAASGKEGDDEESMQQAEDEEGDGEIVSSEKGTSVRKKRGVGRPRTRDRRTDRENVTRKPHASRGVKRPHYKREANIQCRICDKYYKDELSLLSHVQKLHGTHEDTPEYLKQLKQQAKVECKICGKILGNKRNEMTSHMRRVHGEDDDFISKCDECDMEFKRSFLLKEHKRRQHPKHDRILCHLCPASFKLKEYLTEHLKYTHNKQYNWQCDICHKMTSSPKNLRRHKRLHEGAVFQCSVCNKSFHEAGNLRRHVLYVHNANEVSRSQCPHCDRDFSTKNNLLQHVNAVHLKTSSYYCDICKKYYGRKKQLIEHAAMVHPGVPILSTKMDGTSSGSADDNPLSAAAAEILGTADQQSLTLQGIDDQSGHTIIVQASDGSTHVLPSHLFSQLGAGTALELTGGAEIVQSGAGLPQENINVISVADTQTPQYIDSSGGQIDEASLSIAQQALAALEQAGGSMDGSDFGTEQYLSVIGEDGQEIRVQIVRRPPDESMDTQHDLTQVINDSIPQVLDAHNEETDEVLSADSADQQSQLFIKPTESEEKDATVLDDESAGNQDV